MSSLSWNQHTIGQGLLRKIQSILREKALILSESGTAVSRLFSGRKGGGGVKRIFGGCFTQKERLIFFNPFCYVFTSQTIIFFLGGGVKPSHSP